MATHTSAAGRTESETSDAIAQFGTPFDAVKTAPQSVQFAIDPSRGLTRQRYAWFSNGTQFDGTNFTEDPGEITLTTTATGSDTARIRSAFAGQYVSQSYAEPGVRLATPSSDTSIDSNGLVSLSHGFILTGAFFYDTGNTRVDDGFALKIDGSSAAVVWRSGGTHFGNSPVAQSSWNIDRLDGSGNPTLNPSGIQFDPADGWILNVLYTWYNAGQILFVLVDPATNRLVPFHKFVPRIDDPGSPSVATPNLPIQMVLDNDGTATALETRLGGMQFTLYGADGIDQTRDTYGADEPSSANVTTNVNSPIDPTGEPGDPIFALQRESGEEDLELRLAEFNAQTDQEAILYFFDEYDASSALTNESFEDTFRNNEEETKTQFDRSATAYSQSTAVFRGMEKITSSGGPSDVVTEANIEDRIPIGATRIVTGVETGNDATVQYIAQVAEGY